MRTDRGIEGGDVRSRCGSHSVSVIAPVWDFLRLPSQCRIFLCLGNRRERSGIYSRRGTHRERPTRLRNRLPFQPRSRLRIAFSDTSSRPVIAWSLNPFFFRSRIVWSCPQPFRLPILEKSYCTA